MTASALAWRLAAKLFGLLGEFKDLAAATRAADDCSDAALDARGQSDAVACALAALYDEISGPSPRHPLYTDAARDEKDREFDFAVPWGGAGDGDFARQLLTLREAAGLSREQLADAAGVSRESVRLYETGARRPTMDALFALSKALGVPADTFRDS